MPRVSVADENLNAALSKHNVLVRGDNQFQKRARLLQALWREQKGFAPGTYERDGHTMVIGSRLLMPDAKDELLNYLTPAVRDVVREELVRTTPDRRVGRV